MSWQESHALSALTIQDICRASGASHTLDTYGRAGGMRGPTPPQHQQQKSLTPVMGRTTTLASGPMPDIHATARKQPFETAVESGEPTSYPRLRACSAASVAMIRRSPAFTSSGSCS